MTRVIQRRTIANEETYVLSLDRYSYLDRARILYNHLYFSNLQQDQLDGFLKDKFYQKVVNHLNYNPRIIETITGKGYIGLDRMEFREKIEEILECPELLWRIPYREHISDAAQLLVIVVTIATWRNYQGVHIALVQREFESMTYPTGHMESYSQKYTDVLMEISARMEEYADGYYPTRVRISKVIEEHAKYLDSPMDDLQQAAAMFESLKNR